MLTRDGPQWSWQGCVAVTLATGIFVTVILICGGQAFKLSRGIPLSPVGVNMMTAVLSSLVGAVATFLGRVASMPSGENQQPGTTMTTTTSVPH